MAVLGAFPPGVCCRPIREDDLEGVVACLSRGFPQRNRDYWMQALTRLAQRPAVADCPCYGLAIEDSGRIVGVMLTLYTRHRGEGADDIRCNLSSWSVDAGYRPFAAKLGAMVVRPKDVTFINISPAPGTLKLNKAFGFRLFSDGQFAFLPALSRPRRSLRVFEIQPDLPELASLPENERYILSEHKALGCLSLICMHEGRAVPFVFVERRIMRGLVPCCQVVYCRSLADLSRCAGALGRFLLRRGNLLCLVDAVGPVPGLVGRYFPGRGAKYFRGPQRPSLGDLTFTEIVIFGP
jgi:hypothetical protein